MTTLIPQETWNAVLDEVAEEILDGAEVTTPPVDALGWANRLGIEIVFDVHQQARGRFKRLAGRPSIFLRPDDRPERLQWAAAHELGELVAWRVFDRLGEQKDESFGLREPVANLLASRILLPGRWFYDDVPRVWGDLLELKSIYSTASHELIAYRMLDLPDPGIITVFDHGQPSRRRANGFAPAPGLHPLERDCWNEVHRINRPAELREYGMTVQGWPIHEPDWKREILRTTFTENDFEMEAINQCSEWEQDSFC